MDGIIEAIFGLLGFLLVLLVRILIWIVVNFCRALYQVVAPHREFSYWSLF